MPNAWVFYKLMSLRILLLIVFFNTAYYYLLPLYFSGKKKAFYIQSPLVFICFLSAAILMDYSLGFPEKVFATLPNSAEFPKPKPFLFSLMPPLLLGLICFGLAASLRGFAAFESKKKDEAEANRRRLEAELTLLKSQINPHFLLNTLNNLYAISLTDPDKTPNALLKLSEMVRFILYECSQPKVLLHKDLEFIKNYISLQKLRLSSNVVLAFNIPETHSKAEIEPMILIPFIENAFKHGLTTKNPCQITIDIQLDGQNLWLQVKNDLITPNNRPKNLESGIGLVNTQQRLQYTYPNKHQLDVSTDGDKYAVSLHLTL